MQYRNVLDTVEPEVMAAVIDRREALKRGACASGALRAAIALGSIPVALAGVARNLHGQAASSVLDVLKFAFLLENLEAEFYKAVVGTSGSSAVNTAFGPVRGQLSEEEMATFDQIRKHEVAHVDFLRAAIEGAGEAPATFTAESFDFTGAKGGGDGPFAAATSDKAFLLAAAQAFEDTGVRAYKGQAGNLISNKTVLEAALRIHSVEARHAAKIRKMRSMDGAPVDPSGTITGSSSGISGVPAPGQGVVDLIYEGEDNTEHEVFDGSAAATIDASTLPNLSRSGSNDSLTEAFDEPLTLEQVTAIVTPFLVE